MNNALCFVQLRWCQTPEVEQKFLQQRIHGLGLASSIKGVMDIVHERTVCALFFNSLEKERSVGYKMRLTGSTTTSTLMSSISAKAIRIALTLSLLEYISAFQLFVNEGESEYFGNEVS